MLHAGAILKASHATYARSGSKIKKCLISQKLARFPLSHHFFVKPVDELMTFFDSAWHASFRHFKASLSKRSPQLSFDGVPTSTKEIKVQTKCQERFLPWSPPPHNVSLVALAWCPKTKGAKRLLPAATQAPSLVVGVGDLTLVGAPSQMLSIPMKKIMVTLFPLENRKLQQALLALPMDF